MSEPSSTLPPSPAAPSPTLTHQPSTPSATEEATLGTFGSLPPAPQLTCPLRAGRYQILGELGRGGMGEVLRAFDPELKRTLAVKVMLAEQCRHADAERRFLEEAQVTGQLQHPGIPPIHEIGRLEDGRPYIAMKLIEGHSLDRLLKQRPSPAEELPRFVAIFGHICQALAYVHSKGVIHRDLKPANIMVGAFGEVQVMDWGLAKVLAAARTDTAESPSIRTVRSEDPVDVSQAGSVTGTPGYMAPEQARGEVEQLDERADVFGLGAILCTILTGQPPFRGSDVSSVLLRAARGDVGEALARLASCGADAELVGLARRCLTPERDQRPRDARELSAAVEAYQAGVQERLKRAEMERARAEVKRAEERKRRKLALALAAVVVVVVALGGAGAWWGQRQQTMLERQQAELERQHAAEQVERARREEQAQQGTETALAQAVTLRRRALWREAEKVLTLAAALVAERGSAKLKQRVEQAQVDLRFAERLDRIREDKALLLNGEAVGADAPVAYARAFRDHGLDVLEGADRVAQRLAASAIKEELLAALDDWTLAETKDEQRQRLAQVASKVKPEERWRKALTDTSLWRDRERFARMLAAADLERVSPQTLVMLGVHLDGLGGDSLALLKRGCLRHPTDFWLHFGTANVLRSKRRPREAVGYYRAALAAQPGRFAAVNNLANALGEAKDLEGAIALLREAIERGPRVAYLHTNLGIMLDRKKDRAAALAAYRRAIQVDPNRAFAYGNLGYALREQGDLAGALAAYRKCLALLPRSAKAYCDVGQVLRRQKDFPAALAACRKAIALAPAYAAAHGGLGNVLSDQGAFEAALAAHRQAIALDPKDPVNQLNLGLTLYHKKDLADAVAAFHRAIELDPQYAVAYQALAVTERARRHFREAAAAFRKLAALDATNHKTWFSLGVTLGEAGDTPGAVVAFRKAADLAPRDAGTFFNLGVALSATRDLAGAEAAARKAIVLKSGNPASHALLAQVLFEQGHFAEARRASQTILQLASPGHPLCRQSMAFIRDCDQLLKAEETLPDALKGKAEPRAAAALLALGRLCRRFRHQHAAAARFYAAAFTADPHLAADLRSEHRHAAACSAVLAGAGAEAEGAGVADRERSRLRSEALAWLRADLAAWTRVAATSPAARTHVHKLLASWQHDRQLTAVRDAPHLDRLSEEERTAWLRFWYDVVALLHKTQPQR